MIFNSFQFIWLFPVIFVVYWLVSAIDFRGIRKLPMMLLLVISYGLYMQWNPGYGLILFGVTAVTYLGALLIERRRSRKGIAWLATFVALIPLLLFKYYNFITGACASVLANIGVDTALPGLSWVVPIGLSFYTFQAIGYLWDVYSRRIIAERNFLDYMLFVAFFPQILCGPISRAEELLPQIKDTAEFDYGRAVTGLRYILLGLFLKTVVADRIGLYVDVVYADPTLSSGSTCLLAAILYSFQIYGDFAGYSYIAFGVAAMLGFDIVLNFRRPYFATSFSGFWRRWNISLTRWLTRHIYIPLGGNRRGRMLTCCNILITFLVSGIWHGANFTFVVWGLIHGALLSLERITGFDRLSRRRAMRLLCMIIVFASVTLAWVFFRMPSVGEGIALLFRMTDLSGGVYIDGTTMAHIALGLAVLIALGSLQEFSGGRFSAFIRSHAVWRWCGYLFLTVLILCFGVLDSSQFIYVSF